MTHTTHATAAYFHAAVRPALEQHEAEHHLVLGVAEGVLSGRANDSGLFAASVHDAHGLALAAFMVRDRPLLIASDEEDVARASALVGDALAAAGHMPAHVIGAVRHAESFAQVWARRTGREPVVAMRQRVYKLTHVDPASGVSGSLRVATPADVDLITDWTATFEAEALAGMPQSSRAAAERRIAAGEVYLWCDPQPRSMASSARPTKHAVAVNGVYTPREWRQRGYATACVAALSSLLLGRGFEFCVLYTDLANPTSNSIYTKIGYAPVRDFLMYGLPPRSSSG
jgi:predicted GNAT family acetyltransferase